MKYRYNILWTFTLVLGRFFHESGFLADPDLDSEKKSDPDPEKNPDPKHCLWQLLLTWYD